MVTSPARRMPAAHLAPGRRSARWSLAAALVALPGVAAAQPSASASAAAPQAPDALARAKESFRRGVELFKAGSFDRALEQFLLSRSLFASKENTINVALSLDRLGRHDEALEMYEEAVASFGKGFDDEERAEIPQAIAALKTKVGSLDISASVEGAVLTVDGRQRGRLPLAVPVRLLPGSHVVRVLRDGHSPFEQSVTVAAGERAQIDARLEPLAGSGFLRVEDPGASESEVFIDGVRVGPAPWEGTLAPGPHLIFTRGPRVGSAPTSAFVLQAQTALVRVRSGALGPAVRLVVTPISAQLRLNGVALGAGRWEGPLPEGDYQLEAHEDGYFPARQSFRVAPGSPGEPPRELRLQVDASHPRWPRRPGGMVRLEALAGYAFGASLGSSAEQSCPGACVRSELTGGTWVGARVGYEFSFGLSVEVGGGFLSASARVSRRKEDRFGLSSARPEGFVAYYDVDDVIRFRGPWIGGGAGYRRPLGATWALRGRLTAGVVFASSSDTPRGAASTGGESLTFGVNGGSEPASSTPLFLLPQAGLEARVGAWLVGGSLGAFVVPTGGPTLPRGTTVIPRTGCGAQQPGAVGCAGESDVLQGERAHGAFALFIPELTAAYAF